MGILDFSKAFDTVPHERLLSKCHHMGIRGKTLGWLRAFLVERRQRVLVNGSLSTWAPLTSGVPQGTVLGPLLFLIYINDISDNLTPGTTARLFADDCVIYRPISSPTDRHILQNDIDTLHSWSNTWQMHFNPSKCNMMHISTKGNSPPHPYHLAGVQLEAVREHRYLGVTFSDSLSWNQHVDAQCRKASRILGLLRRTLGRCGQATKATAYKSLARPYLEYSASAWDPHTLHNTKQLEQVQRRAARFVTNTYSTYERVTPLLVRLHWQPLQVRRMAARLAIFYRVVNNSLPIPSTHITLATRQTRSANPLKYQHLYTRIDQYRYSFFPRTIIQWNILPTQVVLAPSIDTFKLRLADHLSASPAQSYPQYTPHH